jgi:Tol biopolymer transport system component
VSESKGTSSIWEVSSNGGNLHRVFPQLSGTLHQKGTWTPDGKYFLFQIQRQNRMDLWATRVKDDLFHKVDYRPVRLTSGPMSFNGPQPSADGKRIYAVGEQPRAELVRYDAKSGQFLPYLGGASITDVNFSSDGNWLAYVTYPDGTLWRSRVDGTQKLQLTSAGGAFLPRWSPDGKQIVYAVGEADRPAHLSVISSDGGPARSLPIGEFSAVSPSWLPDGKSIVFVDTNNTGPQTMVKTVDINTLHVTALPDSRHVFAPVASPDGHYLAGPSVDSRKLLLFNFNTRKWSELLTMSIGRTSWSQNSKYIYFDTGLNEDPAFYRVRVADQKLERIASLKGLRRVIYAWIPWSGVTPDGAPLLLRDVSSQEVYALDFEAP